MVNGIRKDVEFVTYLKKFQRDTQFIPRREMYPCMRAINQPLIHIFNNYIDVENINQSDVAKIMKLIEENVSEDLKQCIVARWLSLTNEIDTIQADKTRRRILDDHVFKIVR